MTSIPLSAGLGEIMAPQTLLTVLIVSPDGTMTIDPGALHGRSEIERAIQFVQKREQLADAQAYWMIWVAVELDSANNPMRYKGLSISELWVDRAKQLGYKSLAEHVNRMSEALRGGLNLKSLDGKIRTRIREQLVSIGPHVWERTAPALKEALA